MKYSIIADQSTIPPPLHLSSKFNWVSSNYLSTAAIQLTQDKKLRLHCISFPKGQNLETEPKKIQKFEQFIINEEIDWSRLKHLYAGEDQWVLILQRPFQMYFCLKKYEAVVPIVLAQPIDIQHISCCVSYPDLFFYGYSPQKNKNLMYSTNLQTFQIREIASPKEYQPSTRVNCWSYYSDSRLYVIGGVDKKGKPADHLLWTFNMQNGYWFALDINQQAAVFLNPQLSCQFQNGKVLAVGNDGLYVIELYQSRVTKVEGWKQAVDSQTIKAIKGVYVYQGWFYFIVQNSTLPLKFKINKIKENH